MDVIKISSVVIEKFEAKGRDIKEIATRLMWIPGVNPVKIPANIPKRRIMTKPII